ncbi:rCG48850, isoform CRA_b [Rattus norvegicus]|uniref:RCG48850, isoform CRA_b n=1 Tax=Rattus norvegicus TaxID=10116 RepID=A6IGQ4_RAT|nr:rCG48850, isoform CRA_b [Rattus norvegicus]EDM16644.1 rCG48850, isoform CRA_b [Rattus norvegicus]
MYHEIQQIGDPQTAHSLFLSNLPLTVCCLHVYSSFSFPLPLPWQISSLRTIGISSTPDPAPVLEHVTTTPNVRIVTIVHVAQRIEFSNKLPFLDIPSCKRYLI